MPDRIEAKRLRVFDHGELLGAALRSPLVAASGAVISTDGERYWLHDVKDLLAERAPARAHETLGHLLKTTPLEKVADLQAQKELGVTIVRGPSDGEHEARRRLPGEPGRRFGGTSPTALVFNYRGNAFVLVGNSYHCSKDDDEIFDQDDYDKNKGKCPNHQGGTMVLDP